ncbi:Protein of unknown function [Flexibacter flexilis DSM 6793]|uniref:DUF3098 domain-containing protein n=1 Tax=Flexibacter flexilis DSM 6793 TaxID=927664 RepID=A0A1I1DDT1_9BACT|nr:DUF3098 domain-containing protein [Flexibacter flexilis]SFB73105.1 Protein of unknown function [Flexibacter flexilis DSM 6793]
MNLSKNNNLIFGRKNYLFMIVGIAIILVGFLIMTLDKTEYGFGFMGITLGPLVVMIGFILEIFAIFYKEKEQEQA